MKHTGIWLAVLLISMQATGQPTDFARKIRSALFNASNSRAANLCQEATAAYPDSAVFYYYHSRAMQGLRNYHQALNSIHHALALDSTQRRYRMTAGRLYFAKSQYRQAETIFRTLFNQDTTDAETGIYLIRSLLKRDAYKQAIQHLRILRAVQPENPYFKRYTGYCLYKLDKLQKALSYFRKTLAIDSTDITAYRYTAKIYSAMDSVEPALQTVNTGLSHFPRNTDLYEMKGRLYRTQNNYGRVAEAYQKAWDLGAHKPSNAKNLGSSYFQDGRYKHAIRYLRTLKGKDRTALVTWTLGQAYLQLNQPDSALYFMRRARYALKPDFRIYRNLMQDMARSYMKNRSYEKAIAVYKALAGNQYVIPEAYRANIQAETFIAIADIHDRQLNNPSKALKWYQKAGKLQTHLSADKSEYVNKKIRRLKEQEFLKE